MYYRFQIRESVLRDFIQRANNLDILSYANKNYTEANYLVEKDTIKGYTEKFAIGERNIIDGEQIQRSCFATKLPEKYHIFVSHSHADVDLIESFAVMMKRVFGVNCFVDSMIWKNKDDILKELNKFNIIEETTKVTRYYHEPVMRTGDHVHSILSMALMEMIDKCEMCLFVKSDNSTFPSIQTNDFKETTLSSWIFEEISMMNRVRLNPIEGRPLVEIREFDVNGRHIDAHREYKITHPLDLSNFVELEVNELPLNEKGTKWLDALYANVINTQILIG